MHEMSLTRQFKMDRQALFDAWSSADAIRSWFCPGNMTIPEAEVDFREGGRFRVVMEDGDDDSRHIVSGRYSDIRAGEKLAFSWQWEGSEVTTSVEVLFRDAAGGGSSLELHHRQFPDPGMCGEHEKGWSACFDKLAA